MFKSVFSLLLVLSPFISGHPRPQYAPQPQQIQDYTDSPDAKIISLIPDPQLERLAPRPAPNAYRGRARQQVVRPIAVAPDSYQTVPQSQPQPVAPGQFPSQPAAPVLPPAAPQYQEPQPQQYEPQYIQPAVKRVHTPAHLQSAQQTEPQEHRHSTTTYIPILKFDKSQALDGSYKQSWESGNNILVEETGYLKNLGEKEKEALVQQGSYTYTAPDGSVITTSYTADEGGFHVEGSHLPTPPPIPEEIRKGLDQIYEGIRLQQEADAREAKNGKTKQNSYDENSVAADNYPQQYQQQQYLQPQQQGQYQEPQRGRQALKAQRQELIQSQQQYQQGQQQYQQQSQQQYQQQ